MRMQGDRSNEEKQLLEEKIKVNTICFEMK